MAEAPPAGQPLRSEPKPRKSRAGPKGRPARSGPDPKSTSGGPAAAGATMSERPPVNRVRLTAPRRPADLLARARLAEFAAETDDPLVWLQLAETDRDLVALIDDLAGALTVRFPGYRSQLPRLAAQPGATPADLALA